MGKPLDLVSGRAVRYYWWTYFRKQV